MTNRTAAYISRIDRLLSSVVLDDASAAFDGMDAVLSEAKRSEFLGLSDDDADVAEELAFEVEAALNEVQYMIDDGWADDGYSGAVLNKMENEILPQAEEAVSRFRAEVAA